MVMQPADVDICDFDPGYDVAVTVASSLLRMTEVWMGDLEWASILRSGEIQLQGPTPLCRALPGWFTLSNFAAVPRPQIPAQR
jgi:hypothetical protein